MIVPHKMASHKMASHKIPIAGALLINAAGEVLLQHRDDFPHIPSPNKWSLFGGHVEKNESAEAAMLREIAEEIGYKLEHYQLFTIMYRPTTIAHIYLAPIDKSCAELTLNEGQDFGFFALDQALASLELTAFARTAIQMLQLYQAYRRDYCGGALFDI